MRRRIKRRLFWAAVILGLLLLALAATVAQAVVAVRERAARLERRPLRPTTTGSGDLRTTAFHDEPGRRQVVLESRRFGQLETSG